MAGNTALKQPVITLRVKEPLFIESRFLKAMVYVRRDNEVVFIFYEFEKFVINGFRRVGIAINRYIARPICPMLF